MALGKDPITATRDYLLSVPALDGIPVSVAVPDVELLTVDGDVIPATTHPDEGRDDYDDSFIRVLLSGENRKTLVHREALVTVEVWCTDGEQAASDLMQIVYDALDDWDPVPPFDGWASGPYSMPDPHSGIARYIGEILVVYRIDERL